MKQTTDFTRAVSLKYNLGLAAIAGYHAANHGAAAIKSGALVSWHAGIAIVAVAAFVICAVGMVRSREMGVAVG